MFGKYFSEAAENVSAEVTLNDAMQELAAHPESLGDFINSLAKGIISYIPTILFSILILVIGMLLTKFCLWLLSRGLEKAKADITVAKFVKQCAKIVLYVLLVIVVLSMLGIPTTSIITVIGTAGVAIGLALQDSLSNVAGGFILMVTKPFKIGDYIILNGVEGTVAQIAILHTRLNSASNQAIFIPNSQAVTATVVNNSANDTRRVDMVASISYEDDYEKARQLIIELLANNPKVLKDPEPNVRMIEHASSSINIIVRPWCRNEDYWDVYFDTMEGIRAAFIENGISIPYNQLDVHMIQDK